MNSACVRHRDFHWTTIQLKWYIIVTFLKKTGKDKIWGSVLGLKTKFKIKIASVNISSFKMHHLSCSGSVHLVVPSVGGLPLRLARPEETGIPWTWLDVGRGENEPRAFWLSALYSQSPYSPPVSLTAEGWWKEGALSCLPPFVECPIVHLFACLAWGEKFSGSSGVHIMGSFGHVVKWRYRWINIA